MLGFRKKGSPSRESIAVYSGPEHFVGGSLQRVKRLPGDEAIGLTPRSRLLHRGLDGSSHSWARARISRVGVARVWRDEVIGL